MNLETATYAAVGMAIVAACGHFFIIWLKRQAQKNVADKNIDDRVVGISALQQKIIDEERAEKRRLQEDLAAANQRFAEAVGGEMHRQQQALDALREEHHTAMERVHSRLDDCERKHTDCESRLAVQDQVIAELRLHQQGKAA